MQSYCTTTEQPECVEAGESEVFVQQEAELAQGGEKVISNTGVRPLSHASAPACC